MRKFLIVCAKAIGIMSCIWLIRSECLGVSPIMGEPFEYTFGPYALVLFLFYFAVMFVGFSIMVRDSQASRKTNNTVAASDQKSEIDKTDLEANEEKK